ncbi:MAG: type II toxin-antitoxin system RelE/ParE family toxin [Rhodobacteraceae bacterium]|nr:type II toxin-antitoxin system RelE/ParE family toxin [Paracoccaceae bacterium]
MTSPDLAGYDLTPRAETDLEDIWLFTAQTWSAAQADAYVDGLVHAIETLVTMPTIARERTEFDPPVRIHPSARHLIIYRVNGPRLLVIRVLGGRQNWHAILEMIGA